MPEAWTRLLAFVPTRRVAVALFAVAFGVYWLESLGWPMAKGRDTWDYLVYYLQLFDSKPPMSELQLFRTPLTPVVVGAPLDLGGIWALDRDTGKFLWASPFPFDDPQFAISNVDVKTGQTTINWNIVSTQPGDKKTICFWNTRSYWPTAYHPGTNSLYTSYIDNCREVTSAVFRAPTMKCRHWMSVSRIWARSTMMSIMPCSSRNSERWNPTGSF